MHSPGIELESTDYEPDVLTTDLRRVRMTCLTVRIADSLTIPESYEALFVPLMQLTGNPPALVCRTVTVTFQCMGLV